MKKEVLAMVRVYGWKLILIWAGCALLALLAWASIPALLAAFISSVIFGGGGGQSATAAGQFGDSYGFVNSLVSGCTLLFLGSAYLRDTAATRRARRPFVAVLPVPEESTVHDVRFARETVGNSGSRADVTINMYVSNDSPNPALNCKVSAELKFGCKKTDPKVMTTFTKKIGPLDYGVILSNTRERARTLRFRLDNMERELMRNTLECLFNDPESQNANISLVVTVSCVSLIDEITEVQSTFDVQPLDFDAAALDGVSREGGVGMIQLSKLKVSGGEVTFG